MATNADQATQKSLQISKFGRVELNFGVVVNESCPQRSMSLHKHNFVLNVPEVLFKV